MTKRINLDELRLFYLTVHDDENGNITKYSLDIEAANDMHYEFSPKQNEIICNRISKELGISSNLDTADLMRKYLTVKSNGYLISLVSDNCTVQHFY
ncbi:hypothetical protein [uncultured Eubacterium sp.]|uniref:hypothetical protein n=1 Tax=uncultured Eubacterium sp. TaxID=165185 RepID=UPI0025E1A44A|nr:hypothetical protein [uncultured Eubacterium sp.]